ncbi:hypothetical protein F5887DRAFT_931233 [Amanita rubescens]|nr:hypothetical protein F5887DRAFT_931233 [Amanita rubescens]
MPKNPKPPPSPTNYRPNQLLLLDVYKSTREGRLMSYNPENGGLVVHQPVKPDGERIPPEGLRQHREAHEYLGPGCLCPLLEPPGEKLAYKETAIYITTDGRYKGEHVAECAEDRCGYLDTGTPCPPQVFTEREARPVTKRPLKRTYAQANVLEPPPHAPALPEANLSRRTDWRKMQKLDSLDRPGLTEEQFMGLFVQCDACGLITMHQIFDDHESSGHTSKMLLIFPIFLD